MLGTYITTKSIRTSEDAARVVNDCLDMGISRLLVLTKIRGGVHYLSEIARHNDPCEDFDSYDVLVKQAHGKGLEVHAWFVLYNEPVDNPSDIVKQYPDMLLVNKDGVSNHISPTWREISPVYWVCPSSERYRDYLFSLMKEVIEKYDIDGINLDFVRYPEETEGRQYCYCHRCRRKHEELYGGEMPSDSVIKMRYHATVMCDNVTTSVREFSDRIHALGKQVSAYCFTDYVSAAESVRQDWPRWSSFVDELYLSTYEVSPDWAGEIMAEAKAMINNRCRLVPVVYTQTDRDRAADGGKRWSRDKGAGYILSVMDRTLAAGADGTAFFLYDGIWGRESYDCDRRNALPEVERIRLKQGIQLRQAALAGDGESSKKSKTGR
ncbi:MAG: family 10 glycosylhydrolase [bacterium]|nr:family 10 glycosylhydrolase [bacterium]